MNYYPFHIGDFRGATLHLSNAEELAYRRALDWYYDNEKPIPLDTQWVSRRLRVDTQDLETVLKDFFIRTEEGWRHTRCDAVLADYAKQAEKNRANGRKGGRPEGSNKPKNNPVGSESDASGKPVESEKKPNQEPRTKNQEPINPNAATPDGFAEFWSAYPKKVGKGDAEKAWRKAQPLLANKMPDVLAAIRAAAATDQWRKDGGQYIPNPATWLNQRRWEDGGTVASGWWAAIGFSAEWEAINAGATEKNAHLWRDGRPTKKLAGVELPMWGES